MRSLFLRIEISKAWDQLLGVQGCISRWHLLVGLEFARRLAHLWGMKYSKAKSVTSKFGIGDPVRHRIFDFRGVVYDIDPEFDNTDEWYEAIPEDVRPRKDQPFYHLLAENDETEYVAYVSEQNLLPDSSGEPFRHPQLEEIFQWNGEHNRYEPRDVIAH